VTYTGNGTSQTISHNLGSTPGCIIVKQTSNTSNWMVYHTSLANTEALFLNLTNAKATGSSAWNSTTPTSTVFSVGANSNVNASGESYVAYLFAHDAGGFPVSGGGSTNGISCGTYTGSGGVDTITLGYEPQWVLLKGSSTSSPWILMDVMREMSNTDDRYLTPNTSDAEGSYGFAYVRPTSTGFTVQPGYYGTGASVIYIAIRRGPMKTPTVGTSVFGAETWSGNGATPRTFTSANWTFPADLVTVKATDTAAYWNVWGTRLTGAGTLSTNDSGAELSASTSVAGYVSSFNQTGYTAITGTSSISNYNNSSAAYVSYNIRRAPGFFDVVCWTGTGSGSQAITHNLNAVPEFTITKRRSGNSNWSCFPVMFGVNTGIYLDSTAALQTNAALHPTLPTSTTYYTNDASWGDENIGGTFVTYLFATVAGVSKVGSYTGTGALQTINCGFTSGARFVMIKRTDSTGGWFYYDSVRGITSGNDPYLFFNVSDAQVTGTNYVDTDTTGFKVTAAAPVALNASGGTYLFLAIA
jgi:hypothetical protein